MNEAASPAAARAQRCADDVASEEVATSPPMPAASVFAAPGAALGTAARCDGADFDVPGSAGLVPWPEARMRILRGRREGRAEEGEIFLFLLSRI